MALIKVSPKYVVTVCGKHFTAYSIGSEKVVQCSVPVLSDIASKTGDKDSNGSIVAAEFDSSAKFFAACTDSKQLLIWNVEDEWKLYYRRSVPRRPTAIVFTKCGNFVLAADKAGDVHRFSVTPESELCQSQIVEDSPLLGHVSMILDMKLCADDEFLVTCDRDEKIRVSCYPNAYNIHSYCLGHTEYVTRLCYFVDDDLLASASGDGTVKLWNYRRGELQADVDCSAYIGEGYSTTVDRDADVGLSLRDRSKDVRCMASCHRLLAVSFNGLGDLLLFSIIPGDCSCWRLVFQHRLLLSAAVWDVAFLTDRHLLVLQATQDSPAVVCTLSAENDETFTMVDGWSTDNEKITSLVARINHNSRLFSTASDVSSILPVLHKARTDNMKDYVEKKRLRLAEKQKDRVQSTDRDAHEVATKT